MLTLLRWRIFRSPSQALRVAIQTRLKVKTKTRVSSWWKLEDTTIMDNEKMENQLKHLTWQRLLLSENVVRTFSIVLISLKRKEFFRSYSLGGHGRYFSRKFRTHNSSSMSSYRVHLTSSPETPDPFTMSRKEHNYGPSSFSTRWIFYPQPP